MISGKLFINGKWVDGETKFDVIDPATEQPIGYAYEAGIKEVTEAVKAARSAFSNWKSMPIEKRSEILLKAVDVILARYDKPGKQTPLKNLIHQEMGKMLPEADIELVESSDMLRFFATRGPELLVETTPLLDKGLWPTKKSLLVREPVGVVALIKPWNYPFELPIWALGAALIAGNTVVLKPSELSSLTGLEIGRVFDDAGLPPGVLNIVTGPGSTGKYLIESNDIDMVSFTGSIKTGRYVAAECAKRIRKISLELGGKDPAIVLEDADLELAANGLIWGAFGNAGQVCAGIKRAYIPEKTADQLIELLISKIKILKLGVDIAPLVSRQQLQKVEEQVSDAIAKGAKVLFGAKRPDGFTKGFWYLPTVLTNVDNTMLVMSEETFGPVLPIVTYQSLSEAIELANNSKFGLGASIWTKDPEAGKAIASQLDAGMVWVNEVNLPFPQCPWVGVKESGIGLELSDDGILEYTRIKHISLELSSDQTRVWWFPYNK